MTIELRDVLTAASIIIAAFSMLLVNRNAKRATSIQSENTDMARIRDLKSELVETKTELDHVKGQVNELARRLAEANEAATSAYLERAEMLRFARTPGMDLDTWLQRFDNQPPRLNGTIDR